MVPPFESSPVVAPLVVAVGAISTALVLTLVRAPVTRATVLAATPWMVLGGLLGTLVETGAYEGIAGSLLAPPQGYLAALVVGGVTWVPMLEVASIRNREANAARDLAASGWAASGVLALVVLWDAGVGPVEVLWLVLVPVGAAVVAGIAYLLLGVADAAPLRYTGLVGLLVVFAHTFDGLAVALAVDVFGRTPRAPLAALVADLTAAVGPWLPAGWLFAALKLVGAALAVQVLARTSRRTGPPTYLALGALAAVAIGPGVATLLSLVLG